MKKRLFVLSTVSFSIMVVMLMISAGVVFYVMEVREPLPQEFNSANWKAGEFETRFAMLHDLQQKHKLVGMTKKQVFELLGRPSFYTEEEVLKAFQQNHWNYSLGVIGPDSYTDFDVYFEKDKVVRCELVRGN